MRIRSLYIEFRVTRAVGGTLANGGARTIRGCRHHLGSGSGCAGTRVYATVSEEEGRPGRASAGKREVGAANLGTVRITGPQHRALAVSWARLLQRRGAEFCLGAALARRQVCGGQLRHVHRRRPVPQYTPACYLRLTSRA
jgi:hypothetical protein